MADTAVFQDVLEVLLRQTRASRTTLRLEQPGGDFPVVAEALVAGNRPIRGDAGIAVRESATFAFLDRERRPLIVSDCRTSEPPTPAQLMDFYGVRSEMVAPVVAGGRIVAIVSVHVAAETREWTPPELDALAQAVARILAALGTPAAG
jgi:GAF domain-containing protein